MPEFKPGDKVTHVLASGGSYLKRVWGGIGVVRKTERGLAADFPSGMVSSNPSYWTKVEDVPEEAKDGFDKLRAVYGAAVEQTKNGKGADRHGSGEAFEDQLIVSIGKHLGSNHFELGQAVKKLIESSRLASRGEKDKAKSELLGALNYTAAAYLMLEDKGMKFIIYVFEGGVSIGYVTKDSLVEDTWDASSDKLLAAQFDSELEAEAFIEDCLDGHETYEFEVTTL